jgi:hypothetical protein
MKFEHRRYKSLDSLRKEKFMAVADRRILPSQLPLLALRTTITVRSGFQQCLKLVCIVFVMYAHLRTYTEDVSERGAEKKN